MQLSIVILNYNVKLFVDVCLQSVIAATKNLDSEIILVDNASSDGSSDWIANNFPKVKLVVNDKNIGFPKGNNIGVKHARGKYLCILNPDTVVAEDTFYKAISFMNNNLDVAIMGPKLIDGSGTFLKESKRGVPTPKVAFYKATGLYKISPKLFGKYYNLRLDKDSSGLTDILVGAFMFMRREHFIKLKGFDEDCFMYSDDIDFSYRSLLIGQKNYYNAGLTVIHFKGESSANNFRYQLIFQNGMNYFFNKHFEISKALKFIIKYSISLFSILKRFRGSQSDKIKKHINLFCLISSNKHIKPVTNHNSSCKQYPSTDCVLDKENTSTEIIFDPQTISFKDCIKFMSKQGKAFSYKFLCSDKTHAIGSISSNSKGEVLIMS